MDNPVILQVFYWEMKTGRYAEPNMGQKLSWKMQ
jgi:hypothetical protein